MNEGARRCHHCGAVRRQRWSAKRVLAVCAGLTTVLSLVFALEQGVRIWSGYRHGAAQLSEQLAAARALREAGDYAAAWELLTAAQAASPGSAPLRLAQVEVASDWLIKGYSPATGWIPRASASAPTPAVSPGEAADRVHAPLIVASVLARGEARAELEALVAWANLLRGRELHAARRDLGSDFRRARDIDPHAFTPNLLLAHWAAAFEHDLAAATTAWERALAAGRDRALVRRFQAVDLGAGIEKDGERADAYRRALLGVLDEMARGGEPFPDALGLPAYRGIYVSPRFRRLHFESTAAMLAPERQLAVLEWARRGFEIEPRSHEVDHEAFQLIRAYLLLQAGRNDEALAALDDPGVQLRNANRLGARLDEIRERLTGQAREPDPERDPWGAYAHFLAHLAPGDARFEAAMAALREWETTWDRVGDSLLGGKLPPALDAGVAAWERALARADLDPEQRRAAQENLRFLHYFRGQVRAASDDFRGGVAELEAVSADPGTPRSMRIDTLLALARVYAYSPRALHPDNIRTDFQRRIYEAYLREGLDRLAAALDAGLDDWDRVEKALRRLRDLPEYEAFSLRRGRVPRNPG